MKFTTVWFVIRFFWSLGGHDSTTLYYMRIQGRVSKQNRYQVNSGFSQFAGVTKICSCFKLSRDSCDIKHTVLRLRALNFSISVIQLSFNSPVTGCFFRTLKQGNEVSAGETIRNLTVNSAYVAIV